MILAAPRGFCAGVRRAIAAVEDALALYGPPVYVFRPIVHNLAVVHELEGQGAVFVEALESVPRRGVVVLSAHGVSPAVAREASARRLIVYDAVCPLVAKVHRQVLRAYRQGRHVLLLGHRGHPEIVGTLGQLPVTAATLVASTGDVDSLSLERDAPLAYAVQTTFSVSEAAEMVTRLQARFDDLAAPAVSDICYATTNRQAAIAELAGSVDAVIVVGERFSSNASRLAEVAGKVCRKRQLVAGAAQIDWSALPEAGGRIGLTAAASTPESSVAEVLHALGARYRVTTSEQGGREETTVFPRLKVERPPAPRA